MGLESCIGVAIVAPHGKIVAHISPVEHPQQIQTMKELVQNHATDLSGAIAYVRVRQTAGTHSPTSPMRNHMTAAVQKALKDLHIDAEVRASPCRRNGSVWSDVRTCGWKRSVY